MNNKDRKKITSVLLIVCLMLMVSYAFSWFINNQSVSVATDKDEVQISVSANLNVSINNYDWYSNIILENARDISNTDITSDGVNYYWPIYLDNGDDEPSNKSADFINVTKDEDSGYFVKERIYIRTAGRMDVYLSEDSYVKPNESILSTGSGFVWSRKSPFGEFSADGIVGAMRVAVLEVESDAGGNPILDDAGNEKKTLKCIWIPNNRYELKYDTVSASSATMSLNGTIEAATEHGYGYIKMDGENANYYKYTADDYVYHNILVGLDDKDGLHGENLASNKETYGYFVNQAPSLLSFSGDNGETVTKVLDIYIWCEGTDREADEALQSGKFNFNICLCGINKNQHDDLDVNKLSYEKGVLSYDNESCKDNYLYSTNGYSWKKVGEKLEFENEQLIYLKTVETRNEKSSDVIKFTVPAKTNDIETE